MIKPAEGYHFCDECGQHFRPEEVPSFCLKCLKGANLNEGVTDTILKMVQQHGAEGDDEAANSLRERLYVLFMDRFATMYADVQTMGDGNAKNAKAMVVLKTLAKQAQKITEDAD